VLGGDAIVVYGKLTYVGIDTDRNIHLILKREKYTEYWIKFLKAYEGIDIILKIAPIVRREPSK